MIEIETVMLDFRIFRMANLWSKHFLCYVIVTFVDMDARLISKKLAWCDKPKILQFFVADSIDG